MDTTQNYVRPWALTLLPLGGAFIYVTHLHLVYTRFLRFGVLDHATSIYL